MTICGIQSYSLNCSQKEQGGSSSLHVRMYALVLAPCSNSKGGFRSCVLGSFAPRNAKKLLCNTWRVNGDTVSIVRKLLSPSRLGKQSLNLWAFVYLLTSSWHRVHLILAPLWCSKVQTHWWPKDGSFTTALRRSRLFSFDAPRGRP